MLIKSLLSLFTLSFLALNLLTFNAYSKAEITQHYTELEWDALIPKEDLDILLNPPESILNISDGSSLDTLDNLKSITDEATRRYYQALHSTRVVSTLKQQKVKLPGFIVPLVSDQQNKVTEFFIVPYFGACLHMPPPPPNQIVFVKIQNGIEIDSLFDAYWFEGTLDISTNNHELGNSAYILSLDKHYEYLL